MATKPLYQAMICDVYCAKVLFVANGTSDQAADVLAEKIGFDPRESEKSNDFGDGETDGYTFCLESPQHGSLYVVWVRDGRQLGVIAHEAVHLAIDILTDRGVRIDTDNTEVLTYYVEHWFNIFNKLIQEDKSGKSKKGREKRKREKQNGNGQGEKVQDGNDVMSAKKAVAKKKDKCPDKKCKGCSCGK